MSKSTRILNDYRVIYMPNHPRAMTNDNWNGYVYEHIVVAEENLGRSLSDDECVHHLDFNRMNNRKDNLLVLLKSQHAKLHMWFDAGAPVVKTAGVQGVNSGKAKVIEPTFCITCDRTLQDKQKKYCSFECAGLGKRTTNRPDKKQLQDDINNMSWLAMGRKYGVSDNAVRKWAKHYGLLSQS